MFDQAENASLLRLAQGALLTVLALACISVAALADEPIRPVPAISHQDPARVRLGRQLFHDPRLSGNNRVSCATCHDLNRAGVDNLTRSVGFDGKATAVNTPTVYNAALNFKQFWDGRADSLEAQVEAVVQNPVEMGSRWEDVISELSQVAEYRKAFTASYPDGLTKANVQNAIASFERTLLTPGSAFDRYLSGDSNAISPVQKRGYAKFKQYGCVACHQGVNIGGNMFQRFGVMGDYFEQRGHASEADLGRYVVTGKEADRNVFKVPSLRNVAQTAPYFHDGSAKTLEEAVDVMFRYQLGRTASAEDKTAIVAFLHSLTAERTQPQ